MVGHPHMQRGHHVSTRSLQVPLSQSGFEADPSRAGGRAVHHHATSPPLTSPHARPLASARHPTQRQPRSFQTLFAPRPAHPACQPDVPRSVSLLHQHRRVRSVVHVAALRASEGCASARAEHTQPPCMQWDDAWLGVYSVTGCTARSSRVERGAWWWPALEQAAGVCPPTRGGEAHPPHIEDSGVRGSPPTRADGGADGRRAARTPSLPHKGFLDEMAPARAQRHGAEDGEQRGGDTGHGGRG
jgi:hypothetical protein